MQKAGSEWSFSTMVEYGKLNRERHQKTKHEHIQKRESSLCTFTPKLIAASTPKAQMHGDRGVAMYERAMLGSKLI